MADTSTLRCAFCERSQDQVRALVAGPSVFICDSCVGAALASLCADDQPSTAQERLQDRAEAKAAYCIFCGRRGGEVKRLMARGFAHICNECLVASLDILLVGDTGARGVRRF